MWSHTKSLEKQLFAISDCFRVVEMGGNDGFWTWEIGLDSVWFSDHFWRRLGFDDANEFPDNQLASLHDRVHPDDRGRWDSALNAMHQSGCLNLRLRLKCMSGDYTYFQLCGQLRRSEGGTRDCLIGSIQSLFEQSVIQHVMHDTQDCVNNALREISAIRKALDENLLLSVTDRFGKITDVNLGFCQVSGYSRAELIGQDHRILNSKVHPKQFWTEVWEKISAGTAWQGEVCNRRKDGTLYWVNSTIVPYLNGDGAIEKYVSIRFEISDKKRVEQELLEAQARAESANAAKSEFIANMSHEIRTPMTAILGFADLLATEGDWAASKAILLEYVNTIRRNGKHLLRIINNILDISKIEAGRLIVDRIPTSAAQIVHDVISLMSVRARTKGIALVARFEGNIPEKIYSDPLRLKQILINLVGNAIKFTESGHVTLKAKCDFSNSMMEFQVIDSGIGMTGEQCSRLFESFVQVDTSSTRKFGGSGLGLTISKRLAGLLGGEIGVTSNLGKGSCFTVTVGTGDLKDEAILSQSAAGNILIDSSGIPSQLSAPVGLTGRTQLEGVRILFAEDGPDNMRLITYVLSKAGAIVEPVENGKLAVEAMCVGGNSDDELKYPCPFDLFLTDMQMPVMDGYDATQILRSKGAKIPIIALTAHAMATDMEKCFQAGCNAYLTKPIHGEKLVQTCKTWVHDNSN